MLLKLSVEEAEEREVVPVVISVVVIYVAVIDRGHEVGSEAVESVAAYVVGVETDGARGVECAHSFYHIRDYAEFLHGSLLVGIKVVELHFVVDGP